MNEIKRLSHFLFIMCVLSVGVAAQQAPTPESRLEAGRNFAARGQWREAEENFRLYLRAHPDSADVTVRHALALVRLEQPFDAVIELENYLAATPAQGNSVPVLKQYAELLRTVVNDRPAAEEVLTKAATLAPDDVTIWSELGNSYLARANYADAVRCYERAVQLAPRDPVLAASLAYAYGQDNQPARSAPLFARALKLKTTTRPRAGFLVDLLYARHLLEGGRAAESIPLLTKLLVRDPHLSDAYYWRATAYEKLKDYGRAEADALAALRETESRKDAINLLLRLGRATGDAAKVEKYANQLEGLATTEEAERARNRKLKMALRDAERLLVRGRLAEAIPRYEEIVALLPSFYEAHFALGMSYFQTGKLPEAEASLKKYLVLQPLSPDGNAALGIVVAQRGRPREARPLLERALELDPQLPEARKALAQSYLATAELALADRQLEALMMAIPAKSAEPVCDAECYLLAAKIKMALQKKEAAADIFNRGLKLYGDAPEYLKGLAALLIESSARQAQTADIVKRVAERLPRDAEAHYLWAKWAYLNGQYEQCLEKLTTALEAHPDAPVRARIGALLGETEEKLGRYERAEQAFKISWETNRQSNAPDAHTALSYAVFLARRARDAEAQQVIEQILAWSPAFGLAHFERAKILARQGEAEKAIAAAEDALRYSMDNADATRAAHAFLVRAYWGVGRAKEAQEHRRWIEAHR